MRKEFLAFIKKNRLFNRDQKILLAVSGGLDSVVMADLFITSGFKCGIAHCNFQLRGKDADDDEKFVNKLSDDTKTLFHCIHFDTKKFSGEQGISIQMAARELRYTWFEKVRETSRYSVIATAHHQDDSVETILFNFIKGTGIEGLKGIPVVNGNVVRPLLFASRDDLENYAFKNKLRWREDRSNQSTDYTRNKIRIEILPLIKEINPGFNESILRSSSRINDAWILQGEIEKRILKDIVRLEKKVTFINIKKVKELNSKTLLYHIIRDFGFSYEQTQAIWINFDQQPGKRYISGNYDLVVDRTEILITERSPFQPKEYKIENDREYLKTKEFNLIIRKIPFSGINKTLPNSIAQLDYDKLKFPLVVRTWKIGDKFCPFGMSGKKKLSDFMIDIKIPLNLKGRIKVLESDGEIIWVIGIRIDNRFRLTDNTNYVLQIEYADLDEESF